MPAPAHRIAGIVKFAVYRPPNFPMREQSVPSAKPPHMRVPVVPGVGAGVL